jgi:hypothetical protein
MAESNIREFSGQVVVIGASNARNMVPFLIARGFSVTDLTVPGWVASEKNVESLICQLKDLALPAGSAVVMDLLTNSTYRYKQFDGTLALPFKEGGAYHLPGNITVCSESNFKRILGQLQQILLSCQNTIKVILPPMPRYLSGGCCGNPAHCTNMAQEDFGTTLLSKISNLRSAQKLELNKMCVANYWLLDGIASLLGFEPKQSRPSTRECAEKLKSMLSKDNVHFTNDGYRNIVQCIFVAICGMFNGTLTKSEQNTSGTVSGTGTGTRKLSFFWRGFVSPVGADGPPENKLAGRQKFHPYKRGPRKN